jgi:hypothetical protein
LPDLPDMGSTPAPATGAGAMDFSLGDMSLDLPGAGGKTAEPALDFGQATADEGGVIDDVGPAGAQARTGRGVPPDR